MNLYGVFNGIRAVIEPMRAAGGGSIINTSSEAGLIGLPRYTAYGATKWAVRGLTKTAALELGRDGIRVNSVHPGIVDTPMLVAEGLRLEDNLLPMVRLGRYGVPADIANLVLFLASDASSYITGAELHINGGGLDTAPLTARWRWRSAARPAPGHRDARPAARHLGHAVLEVLLARTAHHEQIAGRGREVA